MNDFRAVLAIFAFSIGLYLIYDLWANAFSMYVLLGCIFGFIIAHYLWPKQRDYESHWYDALELVIDLPFRTIAFALRGLSRIVGKDGVDVDI